MSKEIAALITQGPGQPLKRGLIERREPRPHDVQIDIAYSGVCHSDIHTGRAEWGETIYPFVPGHEIVGQVSAVGEAVTKFKLGDQVGVGCFVDSCRKCASCLSGNEQQCLEGTVFTYNALDHDGQPTLGGYSKQIVVDENYVLRLPATLPLDQAAPLLCAGITLYAPLKRWGAGPGKRVAIVGMGGLGHMGVQLAAAMGCEVTVLSRGLSKRDDGLRLGANAYHATTDPATYSQLAGAFDLVVCTISADLEVDSLLGTLTNEGVLVFVGMPPGPQHFQITSLTNGPKAMAGSLIGGIAETQEMLDYCAEKGITAQIELVSADDIDAVWDRVVAGDVRYRAVIDVATL